MPNETPEQAKRDEFDEWWDKVNPEGNVDNATTTIKIIARASWFSAILAHEIRVKELEAALDKYGKHGANCPCHVLLSFNELICNCGLQKALDGTNPTKPV